jgi:hypothetical protein
LREGRQWKAWRVPLGHDSLETNGPTRLSGARPKKIKINFYQCAMIWRSGDLILCVKKLQIMNNKVAAVVAGMAMDRQIPLAVKVNEPGSNRERTIMGLVKWFTDKVMLMRDYSNQEHQIDYQFVGKIDVMRH